MPASGSRPVIDKRPQLLLVEDDAGVRRSLQLLLEGEGYGVRAFSDGVTLLTEAGTQSADGLIADYRLGDQDGISLLRKLRAAGWSAPALLMTAFASPDLARRAFDAGYAELFDKPLKPHMLIAAIARITAHGGAGASGIST